MSCNKAKELLGGSDECYSSVSPVAEENKRRFELSIKNTQKTFCKIKYDGCLYKGVDEHCDFIFTVNQNNDIEEWIFVELKGKKIKKAIEQIGATIDQIKPNSKISAFVVSSRVPRASKETAIAKERFAKKYKCIPTVKNNHLTYTVS